jgi:hypothetical protein
MAGGEGDRGRHDRRVSALRSRQSLRVAAFVKGTNNVSMETLMSSGLSPDTVVLENDRARGMKFDPHASSGSWIAIEMLRRRKRRAASRIVTTA